MQRLRENIIGQLLLLGQIFTGNGLELLQKLLGLLCVILRILGGIAAQSNRIVRDTVILWRSDMIVQRESIRNRVGKKDFLRESGESPLGGIAGPVNFVGLTQRSLCFRLVFRRRISGGGVRGLLGGRFAKNTRKRTGFTAGGAESQAEDKEKNKNTPGCRVGKMTETGSKLVEIKHG